MSEDRLPVVVIGAGAAGFLAAIFAARPETGGPRGSRESARGASRVLLLERTRDGGRKILMSGGGRCNVLPFQLTPARFVTASSPNTLKKLLLSWPLGEQRRFFEETLGIPLRLEEETGKLFPVSNRSHDVRDGLRALAEHCGVEMRFESFVTGLSPDAEGQVKSGAMAGAPASAWRVGLAGGSTIRASSVIVATGGLSVPATGSDGTGIDIMRGLGHTIHDTYAALTPLTASPHRYAALTGVSLPVTIEAPGSGRARVTRGGFLFTHKGYSGPAVLDVSHLAVLSRLRGEPPQEFYVRWTDLDAAAWDRLLLETGSTMSGTLRERIPSRLAEALLQDSGVEGSTTRSRLTREERNRLVSALTRHPLYWTGDEGYKRAEVTGGGVALAEIDPRTLESRLLPGLFLCGEILDAFGPIGGYNFAWAWATGRAAGLGAAARGSGAGVVRSGVRYTPRSRAGKEPR
ncbi:MAG: aminoacetone oxidase family FAD-binding enzyme [Candidatus Eisenbacteria bacterium]|uniref:Aminoacetone oxidase family FAD-binding enzyme n=1 Tax=Eiseniibacteriota bacterium TaxID=2212470 RepID=A0A538TDF8_UNCEI|nr:MAG: aminoacetone oxidase family FAD-binding enzyme [Candidatus Eisenbacteria bacterium]